MSTPGPFTQLLLDLDSSSPKPSPAVPAALIPAPAHLTPALLTLVTTTSEPAPVATTLENTLAAMAEQPPTKPTAAFLRLVKMNWVREVFLRAGKILNWGRPTNQEAVLGQTRGNYQQESCKKCIDEDGPFTTCVVVSGEFSGSCANCHYNSLGSSCSFRPCKYFSLFASYWMRELITYNCLQPNANAHPHLRRLQPSELNQKQLQELPRCAERERRRHLILYGMECQESSEILFGISCFSRFKMLYLVVNSCGKYCIGCFFHF